MNGYKGSSMAEMRPIDYEWLHSVTPEGALATGFLAIIPIIDIDGNETLLVHNYVDERISNVVGIIEMAKLSFFHTQYRPPIQE